MGASSGFDAVGADNTLTSHTKTNLTVGKNGYLYIYVSNETPNIDVFFDNLTVTHIRGPILEETQLAPPKAGLLPVWVDDGGISSKALAFGEPENRLLFNGYEEQNKEFVDGNGLEWYDYKHRFYDHQIGRFFVQDRLATDYVYYTPYQFAGNEVPNAIDLDGLEPLRPVARMDAYQYTQHRRSYQLLNTYVPNRTSRSTAATHIPNQEAGSAPTRSGLITSRGNPTEPTITLGNNRGETATLMIEAIDNIKDLMQSMTTTTIVTSRNGASDTFEGDVQIQWKDQASEKAFKALEAEYEKRVQEIKDMNQIGPFPGANASSEEQKKWAEAADKAGKNIQIGITLLGNSPLKQLLIDAKSSSGLKQVSTEVKVLPTIAPVR